MNKNERLIRMKGKSPYLLGEFSIGDELTTEAEFSLDLSSLCGSEVGGHCAVTIVLNLDRQIDGTVAAGQEGGTALEVALARLRLVHRHTGLVTNRDAVLHITCKA